MLKYVHASRASQGARPYQEDASAVWPGDGDLVPATPAEPPDGTNLVAVLADGMGGHAGGAIASAIICGTFLEQFMRGTGTGRTRLGPCLLSANSAIADKVAVNPGLSGMGATLVGVAIGGDELSWISVGDSPMYLYRGDELVQLNEDHSLAPVIDRMVKDGKISAAEAQADPRRHYLRSAVTGDELELVDAPERPLRLVAGDIVVIASDGIHTLDNDVIRDLVALNGQRGPDALAEALIEAVDGFGEPHQDNTTVVVIVAQ
jgi:protein phosphatase